MALRAATADTVVYGDLLGLVAVGKAKYLGERYDKRGVKEILVDAPGGYTPNEEGGKRYSMRMGREFYTTALRDYEDWREKWWREAIQNAVDGGATEIRCGVRDVDGAVEVTCQDNGRGMDEDTFANKFMVLGGTTKQSSAGSTGGFGKAKELLVLPWLSWSLESRGILYECESMDCGSKKAPTPAAGLKLTVLMPSDQATTEAAALAFIGKCNLPNIRFYVNGQLVKANFKPGEHIRDFGNSASLFHNKKEDNFKGTLLVRANGIYMFGLYVSSDVAGTLVIELTRPSIEVLSANRDGFRDSNLRYEVSNFVNQLSADVKSAISKKKGLIREKFKGTGKFAVSASDLESALYRAEGSTIPDKSTLSDNQIAEFVNTLHQVDEEGEVTVELNFRASSAVASAMLTDLEMAGPTQVEAAIKQLSWQPDFYLVNEIEGYKVPRKFYPDSMTPRIRQLLHYWAELCRFVLIQLGSRQEYGVGFVFDLEVGAEYRSEDGEDWLMLNPFNSHSRRLPGTALTDGDLYGLTDKDDLNWLYAAAVHECTHIADGISYHNESFASAMTRNVAKTAGRQKQLNAIRKAITKRSAA